MILSLIVLAIVGLVAGFLARALVPGDDSMSIGKTMLLGVVGSFIGGLIGYVLFGADIDDGMVQASGLIGSVVGSVIALMVYRVTAQNRRAFG